MADITLESNDGISEQKLRSEMAERYLRAISSMCAKMVDLKMYEATRVHGKFAAVKADQSHYIIDSLHTPIGVIDRAILRMYDTISITQNDFGRHHQFQSPAGN